MAPALDVCLDDIRTYLKTSPPYKESRIGLSLSRQIMCSYLKEYGGDLIYIQRKQGACFRCVFG